MILAAATDEAWVRLAATRWRELVVDHANCEKKAASTALSLMFSYPDDRPLATRLARLAREELRHFEQVDRLMHELAVPMLKLTAGRYAGELRRALATHEPARKVDLMLAGALIEARSCERFERLAPHLAAPLGPFYADLAVAEARHHELYVALAREAARALYPDGEEAKAYVASRLASLAAVEGELATRPDAEFRFHSGTPVGPS